MHFLEKLPAEREVIVDRISGVPVQRLTRACGHSHVLYFNRSGWTRDRRYLIHASERGGSNDLWACDLADFRLLRLTALGPDGGSTGGHNLTVLNPAADEVAFWRNRALTVQELGTGKTREIFRAESDVHELAWTADGEWIVTCVSRGRLKSGGVSTEERLLWLKSPPLSQVIAVHARSGVQRVLHEEPWLISHVCASPTRPDLLIFCHEGPWLEVKQRIWGLRLSGGVPWPVVPRDPEWGVGHEFWLPDGVTVGYHARHAADPWRHAAGFGDTDSGAVWQRELLVPTHHAIAVNRDFVVIDGTRSTGEYLMLVPRDGDRWGQPRVICSHGSSRHSQRSHVHARLSDDGRQVVFNSDWRSYADVHLVDLPARMEDLPLWPGKPYRFYWE